MTMSSRPACADPSVLAGWRDPGFGETGIKKKFRPSIHHEEKGDRPPLEQEFRYY